MMICRMLIVQELLLPACHALIIPSLDSRISTVTDRHSLSRSDYRPSVNDSILVQFRAWTVLAGLKAWTATHKRIAAYQETTLWSLQRAALERSGCSFG